MCDPSEILILPPDANYWMCDRPFNSTAVVKNTRCFLTCNYGFEVVQGQFSTNYVTLNRFFKKENGHFIDVGLTENGTNPIKLIKHACLKVSKIRN